MPATLGVNVPGPDNADPAAIAATGATRVRCVWRDNLDFRPWLGQLAAYGIDCFLVGDSSPESLGNDEAQWEPKMIAARDAVGDLVKLWVWGNEPDGTGIASWPMDHARVNRLLEIARRVFPYGEFTLSAPGLVSGDTNWPAGLDLDLCDVLDAHPYAKGVATEAERADLNGMLDRYLAYGLPLWLGEYDSRTPDLSTYFRDYPGVACALVFCWDSNQTIEEGITGMGIKDNPTAMGYFLDATGGPVALPPVPQPPDTPAPKPPIFVVGDGMRKLMADQGDVPAADELYFKNPAGQDQWSECMAKSGRLYRYVFSTDTTYAYTPTAEVVGA